MKKSIITGISALSLACAVLAGCSKQGNQSSSTEKTNNQDNALSVAYVNIDSLIDKYDLYNDLSTQLMKKRSDLEAELNSKGKSLERKAMELQQNYEKKLVTPTRAQELSQNLGVEQQRLQQWQQQKSMELADDEQKLNRMVYDSIKACVNEYNKDGKYKMVISNSFGGVLIYGDESLDITAPVLEMLNKRYNANPDAKNIKVEDIDTTAKK